MFKTKSVGKAVVFALLLLLLASAAGFAVGNGEGKGTRVAAAQESTGAPDPVSLTILWPEENTANDINTYMPYNEIYKEIVRKTGVSFDIVGWSREKTNVYIAGGDVPEMVCTNDDVTRSLVDAGMLYDLEPLMEATNSPVLHYALERLNSARKTFDGKLWYVTPRARGPEVEVLPPISNDVYPSMRWDYYKELGCPSIRSFDDFLDVLQDMVKRHPDTPEGRKVYAVGSWNDWSGGFWTYLMTTGIVQGMSQRGGTAYTVKSEDERMISTFVDPQSPLWQAALFMNKANRRGMLHPDSFTMKYADFEGAVVRGEILFAPAVYPMQKANIDLLAKENTAFLPIPFDFGYSYMPIGPMRRSPDYVGTVGWGGKNWSITTNCETPERAMELLNFCFSTEGSRLIQSGVQGIHWDYVDGEPKMKAEVIAAKMERGEQWHRYCLDGSKGNLNNLSGLDKPVICEDGYAVNLLCVPSAYKLMLDDVQKDFSDYYGVEYPFEAWTKRYEAGILHHNPNYKGIPMPAVPDDIKRINIKLEDMVLKALPRCILEPKTDDDFGREMAKTIEQLKAEGAEKSWEWGLAAFEAARAEAYE